MTQTGRVYDRGYRPYDGELGGRRAATGALWRASMRRALGIRRSWRQKLFPWLLLAVVTVPAVVNVGIAYVTRDTPADFIEIITYREYVGVSTALLVFVGLTAPDVVCPDRRNRTLPLLFARPLTGRDYVLAKVGAIATIVFAFGFIPQAVLFIGQMLVSDAALEYLTDNLDVLWKVPIAVAILALYYASLAVAISSFTTRRIIAAASMLIVLLVSSAFAAILGGVEEEPFRDGSAWAVTNLLALPLYLRDVVFEGEVVEPSRLAGVAGGPVLAGAVYVAVVGASLAILLRRYRWVDAVSVTDLDPAFAADATVTVHDLSVWFGQKVALSELSCSFGPGVTGLLGPNGAGKTTLMRTITGLIPAQRGSVDVLAHAPRSSRAVHGRIALVPEEDAVPEALSVRQLVRYQATLAGITDPAAIERAIAAVDLTDVADRSLGGFSKGMRQRGKVAAALVTDPEVLVLDEPLNGADPVQRVALIELFRALGESGRTVIVSSHVLHEVERLADRVVVLLHGRLAAAGGHRAIRDAMADRPRRVLLRSDDDRRLAADLLTLESVTAVEIGAAGLTVATSSAGVLAAALPRIATGRGLQLREVRALDESLESVFTELTR